LQWLGLNSRQRKMIKTIPPCIKKYFNPLLLQGPYPKFRDSCDSFEKMWQEVLKLWKKLENNPYRKARCKALKQEILNLYERAKIKEKERESQKNHKTQEFGYYVAVPKGMARDVYERLRFGRKSGAVRFKFRSNNAICKAKK
jgi:hypothetical protein